MGSRGPTPYPKEYSGEAGSRPGRIQMHAVNDE
jgi:hypothetical protein